MGPDVSLSTRHLLASARCRHVVFIGSTLHQRSSISGASQYQLQIIAAMDGCTKNHLCSREARLSWGPLPLQGVPPKHRAWVWSEVSGAAAKQKEQMNNYYEAMVHMGEACSIASHQIELVSASGPCAV